MPVRRAIPQPDGVFFITFTCAKWLPLFKLLNAHDVVYNWFDYLRKQRCYIIGYVIMPDHVHVIIAFGNTGKPVNTTVGNGKRFMAYELIKRLRVNKHDKLLRKMQGWVNITDADRDKKHEVFEPSFDWKECRTEYFILQKLNYIHWNPCRCEPPLCSLPEEYEHSSARFYITGKQGVFHVTSYTELEDIDLTASP